MNDLSDVDRSLLHQLKRQIQQKAGLREQPVLTQKDFDFLLYFIQEKTGQALSLTTLKRIWRDEYQRLPHLSTLNMLAQIAGDKDWHTAKKEFVEAGHSKISTFHDPSTVLPSGAGSAMPAAVPHGRAAILQTVVSAGIILMILVGGLMYLTVHTTTQDTSATATFSAQPTTDYSIPNSVVFTYDVTGVQADHFYIQQSWDPSRRVEISASNNRQTDIYYEPGYHYAKLIGNDAVLREIPVHIRYNDWFVRFRFPDGALLRVDPAGLDTVGHLGLKHEYLPQLSRPLEGTFQLGYMLSKDFNLSADAFTLEAAVRFDKPYVAPCPLVSILVKGDGDYAWITIGNKGCESDLSLKVGDVHISGKTNDLSALGMDVFTWQKFKVHIEGHTLKLFMNNKLARETAYTKDLGELKEIDLFFNGIGSIDEINLADHQDHSLLSQSF